jgi:iron(III) transport system permease protein
MLAIAYMLMFSPEIGIVNKLLGGLGITINLYSLPGMMVVQGLGTVATVYLMVAPSFRGLDSSLEEAAGLSGASPVRALFTIVIPLVKPALLSAGIVSLMIGFASFDVPGVIGMRNNTYVFSSEMYRRIHSTVGLPEYGAVSALGVFLLILLLLLAKLYHRQTNQTRRFITLTGKSRGVRQFKLGRARIPAVIFTWFFLLWYLIFPTAVLAWTSLLPYLSTSFLDVWSKASLSNYSLLISDTRALVSVGNSALLTLVTPTLVVVVTGLTSWIVIRSHIRGRRLLDNLAFLPFAMPDVIIGVSVLVTYLTLRFIPIYGSVWIIMVALVASYIAYGTRVINTGLMQIHPELEEAAQVSGASWFRTFRTITIRLAQPAMVAVWIWVATHALRALTAPLFLQSGRNPTVSTMLWDYWALGSPTVTAAGGFVLIMVLMLAVGFWQVVERRSERRFRW